MNIVPKDKFDLISCSHLTSASDREVISVIDSLLEWLQDGNWPVYKPVLNRLLLLKNECTDPIKKILQGDDSIWKYWIITDLLSQFDKKQMSVLHIDLMRIITNPSESDQHEGVVDVIESILHI